MLYTIDNGKVSLSVEEKGGEPMSLVYCGAEYLWQGDPKYWSNRAINLFPVTGRLFNGCYIYNGKIYETTIHGFIWRSTLTCIEKSSDTLIFELKSNELTREEYPFEFSYKVKYELCQNRVKVTYIIKNLHNSPIYFCIGGHPGFNVPLEKSSDFEDYYLEFNTISSPKKILFDKNCLITGKNADFPLQNGKILKLKHDLFDEDAIFLENMSKSVTLKSDKTSRSVTVNYEDFSYLGLWHMPNTDAPYICIEPWSALPSYGDRMDDLKTKKDIIALPEGKTFKVSWSIVLN